MFLPKHRSDYTSILRCCDKPLYDWTRDGFRVAILCRTCWLHGFFAEIPANTEFILDINRWVHEDARSAWNLRVWLSRNQTFDPAP